VNNYFAWHSGFSGDPHIVAYLRPKGTTPESYDRLATQFTSATRGEAEEKAAELNAALATCANRVRGVTCGRTVFPHEVLNRDHGGTSDLCEGCYCSYLKEQAEVEAAQLA
jgi:hypothetical protein